MGKKFTVTADKLTVTAELSEAQNPALCKAFWDMLPYRSLTLHTMVAGGNIDHVLPNPTPYPPQGNKTISRLKASPGTIFYPVPKTLLINYGVNVEDYSFPPVAQVLDKDLGTLRQIGETCWEAIYHKTRPPFFLTLAKQEESIPQACHDFSKLIDPKQISNSFVQDLIADLNQAIREAWVEPPQEIVALYNGTTSQKTGLGTYGQYFGTLLYGEGETRLFGGVANLGFWSTMLDAVRAPGLDLKTLAIIYQTMLPTRIGFLGFCRLNNFVNFLQRSGKSFDHIKDKETFIALFSTLSLYGAQAVSWHRQHFPWKRTSQLTYKKYL